MKSLTTTLLILLFSLNVIAFNQDSIALKNMKTRIEKIEGFQKNSTDNINNKFNEASFKLKEEYKKTSDKLEEEYELISFLTKVGIPLTLLALIGSIWKGKKYVDEKLRKKFDTIINAKETDILQIIEKQDKEKKILQNKKILVITGENGEDTFLRNFFNKREFQRENITYQKVSNYQNITEDYDAIFANNDKGKLDKAFIDEYFNNSQEKTVLFYYNTTRKHYQTTNDKVLQKLSFANSPTQIYGNLIDLFRHQEIL